MWCCYCSNLAVSNFISDISKTFIFFFFFCFVPPQSSSASTTFWHTHQFSLSLSSYNQQCVRITMKLKKKNLLTLTDAWWSSQTVVGGKINLYEKRLKEVNRVSERYLMMPGGKRWLVDFFSLSFDWQSLFNSNDVDRKK